MLKLTWRSLAQHRLRTTLSALAVALGVAMVVATSVIGSGVQAAWAESGNVFEEWFDTMISVVLNSVGLVIFAAAGFLVFNAFAMAVTQRRRQIGVLRSLGMSRRQVLRLVLAEALFTGGIGTLLGLLIGPLLGRGLLAIVQIGLQVGPGQTRATNLALATVMGLVVSLLSALVPAQRAARIPPLAALRETQETEKTLERRRRSWIGTLLIAALLGYLVLAPPGEWTGKTPPWEWIMPPLLWVVWLAALGNLAPTLIAGLLRLLRGPLCHLGKTTGRLVADNLERASQRVTLTVLTFSVGLALIIGMGGILAFNNDVLLGHFVARALQETAWFVHPFDSSTGIAQLNAYQGDSLRLNLAVIQDVRRVANGRARVGESYTVLVPAIGSPIPGFPSLIMGVEDLKQPGGSKLIQGDWETATPLLEQGCGLLLPEGVAGRHSVEIGDTLSLQGRDGPVECVVAAIGAAGFAPMSVIGIGAKEAFVAADRPPDMLSVRPLPGTDHAALEADLWEIANRYGDEAWITGPEDQVNAILGVSDQLQGQFNALTLLAQVAAALGMINTMMMNVSERRRELWLLRAVGATRRQVTAMVMGEAALMGLIGAVLGAIAGVGLGGIWALAYGGLGFSVTDLPLWKSAGEIVLPALHSGWMGMAAAPLLAAAAAYPAIRATLRGTSTGH